MNWKIRCWLLSVLLLSAAGGCGEPAEPPSPPEASQQPARPPASADAFRRTVVTPYLDREIPPGKNVLWICAGL